MLDVLKNIIQFLGSMLEWLIEFVTWALTKILLLIFNGVISILSAIPVPDFLDDLDGNVGLIDPGVLYFVQPLQLGTGITWIVSAYLLRFLIRRIPVIG